MRARSASARWITCSLRRRIVERGAALVPVDRAAVVGVDQRQAEQLVALVDVGHARDGELQQRLAERRAVAGLRDLARNGSKERRKSRCV